MEFKMISQILLGFANQSISSSIFTHTINKNLFTFKPKNKVLNKFNFTVNRRLNRAYCCL